MDTVNSTNKQLDLKRKVRGKSFGQILSGSIAYLKGYLKSIRFENRVPISVRGPLRIIKNNGSIKVGEFTEFWPGVKLSCFGKDSQLTGPDHHRTKLLNWRPYGDSCR